METQTFANRKNILVATAAIAVGATAAYWLRRKNKTYEPLPVAPYVDLNQYMGEWYEIARLPVSFEKNCIGTKARYTLQDDGSVEVLNTCYKGSWNGKLTSARGKATVADPQTNAKLKVQFFWPFSGDYWILEVGNGYEYALVGEPTRENLWVLSRTPQLDLQLLHNIVAKAERLGFNTSQLVYTAQQGGRSVG